VVVYPSSHGALLNTHVLLDIHWFQVYTACTNNFIVYQVFSNLVLCQIKCRVYSLSFNYIFSDPIIFLWFSLANIFNNILLKNRNEKLHSWLEWKISLKRNEMKNYKCVSVSLECLLSIFCISFILKRNEKLHSPSLKSIKITRTPLQF
jgi:hypothetical protein